ncbi:hypothetical protein NBRC10512_006119 [Rhodotorula toruloides]|uniref:RHTO0S10e01552g1_1 n=2 Tax=Rhodotorula toruloides TaxID=5286 RepID=A0A061B4T9_RHOTO|nr:uncharacterized protein RHTO_05852 [Rhodotorula toruloides NP11]EMS18600.1 hypothetical protein RHTO_05852 [Rhodotorula toruloides NP11]CDR44834.1 RHTO0S10e01552g1_1 [Rhodotorula toruloides]
MASTDSSTALFEQTKALLTTFAQHPLESTRLVSSIPVRDLSHLSHRQNDTENYTRWTQGATDVTAVTGVSEDGLVMDSADRERIGEDLRLFKEYISNLKFAYLESCAKLEFVNHILDADGYKPVLKEENDQLEEKRAQAKAALKERKQRVNELEALIRSEAEALDQELQRRTQEAEHADRLMRECEAMETEIAMLKNKRSPTERLTTDQIAQTLEAQELELVQIGQRTKQCDDEMKTLKPRIKASKISIERYSNTAKQLRREQEERDAKGVQDERAEKGCEWVDTTTALYKSLLGIHNAYAVGSPPSALIFEYGSAQAEKGDLRRLSVEMGLDGKMVDAKILDSSDDISDIVQAHLASQDIRALVQQVRTRFGW